MKSRLLHVLFLAGLALLILPVDEALGQARGFISGKVVDEDELRRAGEQLAIGILERASSESIARTKRILLQILGLPLDEALQRAAIANAEARATADCKHGIATFLATKAPPTWREPGD